MPDGGPTGGVLGAAALWLRLVAAGRRPVLGFELVAPPLQTHRDAWEYDTELYKRRNEIERLFGRTKRFRRVFIRYDKTDLMFSAFVTIAFIADQLR